MNLRLPTLTILAFLLLCAALLVAGDLSASAQSPTPPPVLTPTRIPSAPPVDPYLVDIMVAMSTLAVLTVMAGLFLSKNRKQ